MVQSASFPKVPLNSSESQKLGGVKTQMKKMSLLDSKNQKQQTTGNNL